MNDISLAIMAALLIASTLVKQEQAFIDLSMQDVSAFIMFPNILQTAFGVKVALMKSHLLSKKPNLGHASDVSNGLLLPR